MGLFDRNRDDAPTVQDDVALGGIDFTQYDLAGLREDIRSIVDVPGAVGQALKWAVGIPVVIALVAWIAFSGDMSRWLLVPFVFGAFVLSFLGSTVIAAYFVTRRRLDTVADASGRVVDVVGDIHGDVVRVREGLAETSVHGVATGVLQQVVFPTVFETVAGTAETMLGPLGFVARRGAEVPMKLVERSVLAAVDALPDRQLGELVSEFDATTDAMPELTTALAGLTTEYESIRSNLTDTVQRVSRTALLPVVVLAVGAMIPLAIWLLIGTALA